MKHVNEEIEVLEFEEDVNERIKELLTKLRAILQEG